MSKIHDKVCIVTGGGGGIGLGLVRSLAAAGAGVVYIVDINADYAKEAAASLPSLATNPNFRVEYVVADVGKEEDVRRVILAAWEQFGKIDMYFSNAGIFLLGGVAEEEVSKESWNKIWNINVKSHIWAARFLLPLWKENSVRGTFVITASAAGLLMQIGGLPYHVTKHAAVSVADWLAVHHQQDGVSVHCVCPQFVRTEMTGSFANGTAPAKGSMPRGVDTILEPKDVANATIKGVEDGTFLVLPHPEVQTYFVRKGQDYHQWVKDMRKFKRGFESLLRQYPHESKL